MNHRGRNSQEKEFLKRVYEVCDKGWNFCKNPGMFELNGSDYLNIKAGKLSLDTDLLQ